MTDMILAARRHLSAVTELTDLLGPGSVGDQSYDTWIFRHRLPVSIENTGMRALLLKQGPAWSSKNNHNTLGIPRLVCEVYSDPPRGMTQPGPQTIDAHSAALAIFAILSRTLHRMDAGFYWDDLRIVTCKQLGEPSLEDVLESDGLVYGTLDFAVSVG